MSQLFQVLILGFHLIVGVLAIPLSFDLPLPPIASTITTAYVENVVTVFAAEAISTDVDMSTVWVAYYPPLAGSGITDAALASAIPVSLYQYTAGGSTVGTTTASNGGGSIGSNSMTLSTSINPPNSPTGFNMSPDSTRSSPTTTPVAVVNSVTGHLSTAVYYTSSDIAGASESVPTSTASDSASCLGQAAACEGDITYYGGGLGACGINVDPSSNGIALPYEFMGTPSNDNLFCGKTMTIFNPATGESVQGTVVDKCMGCTGRSIDMMESLMNDLTNGEAGLLGRVHNAVWWFN